jgi:pyruvate/2-oxoglutarate dehydrogenase complex dihydrolipoamide acyltransferase (E2) component
MASPRKHDERLVSRTYRAAIRLGEDFVTIEETIALPIDASDDEIAQAVDTGWRIYQAQREAAEGQIQQLRELQPQPTIAIRDPEAPASEKQRNFVGLLQDDLRWSDEQLARYATEQGVDLVTMTKGQASSFIDGLKRIAEERGAYAPAEPQAQVAPAPSAERARAAAPASEKQLRALHQIAQERGLDLDGEARQRYGVEAAELSMEQASALLTSWQRPRGNGQRRLEPAL